MKTFDEVFNEIKGNVTVSPKGKKKKTFSRSDFDRLLTAFLNETGYTIKAASTKGGELEITDIKPVQMFRDKVITKILTDNGHDKAEAAKIAAEYEFTKVDGLYEIISEVIYQYMAADKKFAFVTKEDFTGSLTLTDVDASEDTYKSPADQSKSFKVKTKAHKKIKSSSKAPKWLKKKFEH